jgi:hypothetical protein
MEQSCLSTSISRVKWGQLQATSGKSVFINLKISSESKKKKTSQLKQMLINFDEKIRIFLISS